MPYKEPTHHAIHERWGFEADIYIAQSLQEKLSSPFPGVRVGAQSSVAIAFKAACRKNGHRLPSGFVEFHDLLIREIDFASDPAFAPMGPGGEPIDFGEYDEDEDSYYK